MDFAGRYTFLGHVKRHGSDMRARRRLRLDSLRGVPGLPTLAAAAWPPRETSLSAASASGLCFAISYRAWCAQVMCELVQPLRFDCVRARVCVVGARASPNEGRAPQRKAKEAAEQLI